jgi:hypothetical protein
MTQLQQLSGIRGEITNISIRGRISRLELDAGIICKIGRSDISMPFRVAAFYYIIPSRNKLL